MNARFPVLSILSLLLRLIGGIDIVASVAIAVVLTNQAFFSGNQPIGPYTMLITMASILGAVFSAIFGLVLVAIGETIGVLFAIESNTRR